MALNLSKIAEENIGYTIGIFLTPFTPLNRSLKEIMNGNHIHRKKYKIVDIDHCSFENK
jgi:hypothetical protein